MSLFVLEGPDYAGKTTFSRAIREYLIADVGVEAHDVDVIHTGEPTPEEARDLARHYLSAITTKRPYQHIVFDRLHVGELVYGPVLRGSSALSHNDMRTIDDQLERADAIRVYVNPGEQELIRRFRGDRGDALVKKETTLLNISRHYDLLIGESSPAPWHRWDGTGLARDFLRRVCHECAAELPAIERTRTRLAGDDGVGPQC